MRNRLQLFVQSLLLFCSVSFFINSAALASVGIAPKSHHTKNQKQLIFLAKRLHQYFIEGKYNTVYSYFGTSVTDTMSRKQWFAYVIPNVRVVANKEATLTVTSRHTYISTYSVHSSGAEQPKSGQYTSICFMTFYKSTPIHKEMCFAWRNNSQKVLGFHLRFVAPKSDNGN